MGRPKFSRYPLNFNFKDYQIIDVSICKVAHVTYDDGSSKFLYNPSKTKWFVQRW